MIEITTTVLISDDYYDTEDPSVNLHEFIINSMQVSTQHVRVFLSGFRRTRGKMAVFT